MENSLDILGSIKESAEAPKEKSYTEILSKSEEINKISEKCKSYLSGYRVFRYPVYIGVPLLHEKITQRQTVINFSNEDEEEKRPAILWDPTVRAEEIKRSLVNFTGESKMLCQLIHQHIWSHRKSSNVATRLKKEPNVW